MKAIKLIEELMKFEPDQEIVFRQTYIEGYADFEIQGPIVLYPETVCITKGIELNQDVCTTSKDN